MAKMRIYEIAKSLNMKSTDLVNTLNENGFSVKSPQSNVEDAAIAFILKKYSPKKEEAKETTKDTAKTQETVEKKEETKNVQAEEKAPVKTTAPASAKKEKNEAEPAKENRTQPKAENAQTGAAKKEPQKPETQTEKKAAEKKDGSGADRSRGGNRGSYHNQNGRGDNSRTDNGRTDNNRGDNSRTDNNRGDNNRRDNNRGGYNNTRGSRDNNNRGGYNRDNSRDNGRDNNNRGNFGSRDNNRDNNNRGGFGGQGSRDNNNRGGFRNNNRGGRDNNNRGGFGAGKLNFNDLGGESVIPTGKSTSRGNGYNNKNKRKEYEHDREKPMKKDPNRKGAFIKPKPVVAEPEPDDGIKSIILPETLTLKELADKMKVPAASIVKKLFMKGQMVSINQDLTYDEAEEIALEYNYIAEKEVVVDVIEELLKEEEEDESLMTKRPPVVCVMGHVDHGKTSLLDAIRQTNVTEKEAGGITQHIGAYVVKNKKDGSSITFLDTPGHEAFTSMRMRGAQSTDIAILVVAADDGVMPQTVEAISHAKAAGVEIIVAVNKIDKPSANVERVKQELVEYELVSEDWGGSTIFVPVSAHTKEGIDQLLEMISLTADILELKANKNRLARGIVIEAQLDKGRGPVATVLVQKGTLHVGDAIAIGSAHGKVRAMIDDKGRRIKEATPSTPVEILGLNEVPDAGEVVLATENEKEARNIAETFIKQGREKLLADTKTKLSLDGLFSQIQAGNIKELNLIVKADVQGSVEAVKQSLLKLSNEEVAIRIIHAGVGAINESDVSLASASNAIIIGFNVRADNQAKEMADREQVDLRLYRVIYNAIEDIEAAMKGMLDPIFEEKVIGHAEVRQVFKASGLGNIAGSYVLDGKIVRNASVRISRDGEQLFDGPLASLKRFKDDVKEVAAGYECGLVFEGFNDLQEFDQIEVYVMEEVPR